MRVSMPYLTLDIIPFDLAEQAYRGTSFMSEVRARQIQKEFCNIMQNDWVKIKEWDSEDVNAHFQDHLNYCVKLYKEWLHAKSRCISTMIAGPSNFPVRRAEKATASEDRKYTLFSQGRDKSLKRIKKAIYPYGDGSVISSDDPAAIEKLSNKLIKLVERQTMMKKVNLILRRGGAVDLQLKKIGVSSETAKVFAGYELTNNLAKIKQTKQRLNDLKKAAEAVDLGRVFFDGGYLIVDRPTNRIKVYFDEKPSAEKRDELKNSSFKWSVKNLAWQRQITNSALWAAELIFSVKLKEAYI